MSGGTSSSSARALPNIIVTGTPGVGKTSHCEALAERSGLRHVSVNQVVKDKGCHEGWDEEYQSWVVDEDKVRATTTTSRPSTIISRDLLTPSICCRLGFS